MNRNFIWIGVLLLTGCASLGMMYNSLNFTEMFGPAKVQTRVMSELPEDHIDYWKDVKPVIEQRCVVCHGCFDAPCQLKMTAVEGIDRGASKQKVYDATRIEHAPLTRLFEDATTTKQWREKDFFPVLNEHGASIDANKQASLMYQLLELKEQYPQPNIAILPDDFTIGYERAEVCATPEQMPLYTKQNPLWGMPYALPGLNTAEQASLKIWLEQGAKYTKRAPLPMQYLKQIEKWEAYLNGPARKQQLVNRYIYEHLFLANIYFEELESPNEPPKYFKIVRSSTSPGQPVKLIATRRPYDDPNVPTVYYRIVPYLETIVTKTHLPYALNKQRMDRWNELFYETEYNVRFLPDYREKIAANPFKSFEQLPMASRYKFMLDEAQYIIMNFIKGPVCRGQVAVNVIQDHFWVFFTNPDLPINTKIAHQIDIHADDLELPSAQQDIYLPLTNWVKYAKKAKLAAQQKEQFLIENFASKDSDGLKIDLNLIWNGANPNGGNNNNATLTVFRHFDNASVHKGLLGEAPQTAWVINYPLLERIYYLLVAGYDVYGNVGHQLLSRIYMDFLRMGGESAFLNFLPQDTREKELAMWYQDADDEVIDFLDAPDFYRTVGTSIEYLSDSPKIELYEKLTNHIGKAVSNQHKLAELPNKRLVSDIQVLNKVKGRGVSHLAELTYIKVNRAKQSPLFFSMMKNLAHKNITSMFAEDAQLLPEQHNVTVLSGIIGSYPNALMEIEINDVNTFVEQVSNIKTAEDYANLMDVFGMRRTNPDFWQYSDSLHQFIASYNAIEAGFVDYNRLENR